MKSKTNLPISTDRCCPLCDTPLSLQYGNQIHVGDSNFGVTLYCPQRSCPADEVSGHGKNESIAYDIILAKVAGKKLESQEEAVVSEDLI